MIVNENVDNFARLERVGDEVETAQQTGGGGIIFVSS